MVNFLLIRGLAREARHWGEFPVRLEAAAPGSHAFSLDLPGVGTEHDAVSPVAMSEIVDDMRERWSAIETDDQPWVVFGISLGGMVAMNWCEQYEGDFIGAVIANTSAANVGLPHERITVPGLINLARSALIKDAFSRERQILTMICNEPQLLDPTARTWARYAEERPIGRRLAVRQILAASRYPAPRRLDVPTLVLASPNDRFVSAKCSERLAERLGAPIERHATAGHAISVDAPEWVAERVVSWAATCSGVQP